MRVLAVLAAALLLSSCALVRRELAPTPAPPPPAIVKPDPVKPRPKPHVDKPASAPVAPAAAPAPPPPDYSARCHEMADNRAADARQLGAPATDQAKVQSDTYRDCMAQSVK